MAVDSEVGVELDLFTYLLLWIRQGIINSILGIFFLKVRQSLRFSGMEDAGE